MFTKKEVRSILEYAAPVWHSGLTKQQSNQIERIQKQAFRIILGQDYISYEVACTILSMEPLYIRRTQLCINFAKKDLKRTNSLLLKVTKPTNTRSIQKIVKEYNCRTKRFQNSSIPYMSKLLNNQWVILNKCYLMDNGDGARFMVLGRRMAHKFTVLYFLPHVIRSATTIIFENIR